MDGREGEDDGWGSSGLSEDGSERQEDEEGQEEDFVWEEGDEESIQV